MNLNADVSEVFRSLVTRMKTNKTTSTAIVLLVGFLLGTVAFFYFYYIPKTDEMEQLEQEAWRNEAAIKQLTRFRDMIPELEAQIQESQAKLEKTASITPRDNDLAIVLDVVSELAKESDLTLQALNHTAVDWNWAQKVKQEKKDAKADPNKPDFDSRDIGQVQISAVVEGSYNSLVAFSSALERVFPNSRFDQIQVDGIAAKTDKGSKEVFPGTVSASMLWSMWVIEGEGPDLRFAGSWDKIGIGSIRIPSWRSPFQPYNPPVTVAAVEEVVTGDGKPIRLAGVARNGKSWRGVLVVGQSSYMVKPGDVVEGMRVTGINSSGVMMSVNQQPTFVKLGEGW